MIITNSSNNYGAYQHPENLIPLVISNALMGKPLPIYGDGQQIRDWLFVEEHVQALYLVLTKVESGKTIISVEIVKKQTLKWLKQFVNYSKNLHQISLIILSITMI